MILIRIFFGILLILSILFLIQKYDSISNCKTNCNNTGILIGILICLLGISKPLYATSIILIIGIISYLKK